MKKQTAKRIKNAMKIRGVSADKLASLIGASPANINRWTSGKDKIASEELNKVARALRVNPGYLACKKGAHGPAKLLGKRLLELKEEQDFANTDLADAVGASPASVSRWLAGKSYPKQEQIQALSELFDVAVEDLANQGAPEPEPEVEPEAKAEPEAEAKVEVEAKTEVSPLPFHELLKRAKAARDELDVIVEFLEKANLEPTR
jgi:transcriptional regulator with XRE-family HTH domain